MTDPTVNLRGDATSLVSAINQATTAFVNFERETARIQKNQAKFNADGNLVSRTLLAIDAAGNKVLTTFKEVEGVLTQTSTVTKGAAQNLRTLASQAVASAEAQHLLNRATALGAEALAAEADAFRQEETAARTASRALQEAAAAHELNAIGARNVGAANAARTAASTKLTKAINAETLADEANAVAAEVSAAADIAAAEAASLRARASVIRASVGDVISRKPAMEQAKAQQFKDEDKVQKEFQDRQKRVEADRLAAIKKQGIERVSAEKRVEAEFTRVNAARTTSNKKIITEREADEKRVAAAFHALVKKGEAERLASDKRVISARFAANKKAEVARLAAIRKQTVQRISDEDRVAAAFRKLEAKRLTGAKKLEAVELASAARIAAAHKKAIIQRLADEQRVAAEFIRLENLRRANTVQTRTPLVARRLATGTAGRQEIGAFLQAEVAVRKFAATSTIAFKQVDVAIAQARAGTLKFTGSLTQAEIAALKLVEAERKVALGANQAATGARGLAATIKDLGKLVGISLVIGGAFRLVQAFTDATRAAGELSIKIAEIETISTQAARSTESWSVELRALSDEFGIDTLKQAEGAYQILSRQIKNTAGASIQGAEALKFLAVANKLAVTGVTDTATATNLLTSTMNAFKIPAEEAELIAAKLFKTVELGALRIENIADIMGRVAVPAKQLGLSLDEVLGSIDGLTRQGFKADEAITGIRNVILKMIKPTESGKKALDALGASTGQALIQARGFIPALQDFTKELGNTVEGTAKGFGRIRAIVGALGLTGENAAGAADSIRQIKDASIEAFGGDTQKVLQSTGKQFEIMREQAQNYFEKELGGPALRAIAKYVEEQGGIKKILAETIEVLKVFGKGLFAMAKVAVIVAENIKTIGVALLIAFAAKKLIALQLMLGAMGLYETATFGAVAANEALAISAGKSAIALKALSASFLLTPLAGILALTAAIAGLAALANRAAKERLKNAEQANLAIFKNNEELKKQIQNANETNTRGYLAEVERRFKGALRFNQKLIAEQNKQIAGLKEQAKATARETGELLKIFGKSITKQITTARTELKKFEKTAKKAAKLTRKILQGEDKAQFEIDIDVAGLGTKLRLIRSEIEHARRRVAAATAAGNLKEFEVQRKRLNTLVKQRVEAQVKFAGEQSKIDSELEEANLQRIRARSREERRAADDRIKDLNRQQRILKDGTAAQLKQEHEIQKIREQARKAQDASAYQAALNALAALKREQERINTLALTERKIRAQTALESAKQAKQAAEIARINEDRAEAARKEEQRVRALQLVFNLVSKEAEAFKIERVTEGKTAEKINEAIKEQQKHFARLITLSRELTKSQQLDPVFIRRETVLRKQGQAQIEKLELEAKNKRIAEIDLELKERLKAAKAVQKLRLRGVNAIIARTNVLKTIRTKTLAGLSRDLAGERLGMGLGIPDAAPGRASRDQNQDVNNRFDLLLIRADALNSLIAEQTKTFEESRQGEINALVKAITLDFDPVRLEETRVRRADPSYSVTGVGRGINDINRTVLAFVQGIQRASTVTAAIGQQQSEINTLVAGISDIDNVESVKAIGDEVWWREQHTSALEYSTKAIEEFNALVSGKKRALSGPTKTPEATTAAPLKDIVGKLPDSVREQLAEGINSGLKKTKGKVEKQFKDETKKGITKGYDEAIAKAKKKADAAAAAQEVARANQDTALKKEIAELEAGITRRQGAAASRIPAPTPAREAPKAPTPSKVDRTIRLGYGAPSIQSQQARIAADDAKNRKAQDAFREALKDFQKEERGRKQARAIARGDVSINTTGDLVTKGRGNVNAQGQLVTRGTPIGGEGPTQKKQLTVQEKTEKNTADTVKAIQEIGQPGQQTSEEVLRVASGLSVKKPTEALGGLSQGEDAAKKELARITGRNAKAQNRLLQATEYEAFTAEGIVAEQGLILDLIGLNVRNMSERRAIDEQRIPIAQATLDAEREALKAKREALLQTTSDTTKPLQQFGQTPRNAVAESLRLQSLKLPVAPIKVGPTGYRAEQTPGSHITNVGGIEITVVSNKADPKAVAKEVAPELQRQVRQGILKLDTRSQ